MDGFPVSLRFPVHWGDMDALAHVNNTRYFVWFESVRIAMFQRLGLATEGQPEQGPILAHTRCDFLEQVRHPAEVVAGARIEKLGNTSFTMGYGIALAETPDRLVAKGEGVVVLINFASGRPIPLPDDLRQQLEALQATSG